LSELSSLKNRRLLFVYWKHKKLPRKHQNKCTNKTWGNSCLLFLWLTIEGKILKTLELGNITKELWL
jgi:hypothetical protein